MGIKLDNAEYEVSKDWKDETISLTTDKNGTLNMSISDSTALAGSMVDISGDIFIFRTNEAISGSGDYIKAVKSNDLCTLEYADNLPDWDRLKCGYYEDDSTRYIFNSDGTYIIEEEEEKDYAENILGNWWKYGDYTTIDCPDPAYSLYFGAVTSINNYGMIIGTSTTGGKTYFYKFDGNEISETFTYSGRLARTNDMSGQYAAVADWRTDTAENGKIFIYDLLDDTNTPFEISSPGSAGDGFGYNISMYDIFLSVTTQSAITYIYMRGIGNTWTLNQTITLDDEIVTSYIQTRNAVLGNDHLLIKYQNTSSEICLACYERDTALNTYVLIEKKLGFSYNISEMKILGDYAYLRTKWDTDTDLVQYRMTYDESWGDPEKVEYFSDNLSLLGLYGNVISGTNTVDLCYEVYYLNDDLTLKRYKTWSHDLGSSLSGETSIYKDKMLISYVNYDGAYENQGIVYLHKIWRDE